MIVELSILTILIAFCDILIRYLGNVTSKEDLMSSNFDVHVNSRIGKINLRRISKTSREFKKIHGEFKEFDSCL